MALSSRSTHTPWRLDLDWRWHQNALEYGCIFIINPDAHSIRELDHAHWGVEMARKGGVPADRVLNAMPLSKMLAYLAKRKRAAAKGSRRRAPSRESSVR
ncbi:histidinol phosphatase-like PHP family hydrolase [Bradyrhizobium sp. LB14.3]|jgi:DNA polymerase (family 10)